MILDLSQSLAEELRATLEEVIGDMSSEIAGTDNPGYRRGLEARRQRLKAIHSQVDGLSST